MSHTILNPKCKISKYQNEIDEKLILNFESMSHAKCALSSSVI
jgi:hypothetical protein